MNPSYSSPVFGAGANGQPQAPAGLGAQTPVSSGDIVLTPTEKKTSHKGIIIGLILAVLLIGGLFAAVFLMRGGSSSGVSNDAKLAFNRYANYLLYGKESEEEIEGEYDESRIYAVNDLDLSDGDELEKFFEKTDSLWGQFRKLLGNKIDSNISDAANGYHENYNLISLISGLEDGFEEELDLEFDNQGAEVAKELIATRYRDFADSSYEKVRNYGQIMVEYYDLYLEDVAIMVDAGCFTEVGCAEYNDAEISEQMRNGWRAAGDIEEEARINIVEGCWDLKKILNGEMSPDGEES